MICIESFLFVKLMDEFGRTQEEKSWYIKSKTKYLEYKLSKQRIRDYNVVLLDKQKIPMSNQSKYLDSIYPKVWKGQ